MADERKSFPYIPERHWRQIRNRFVQRVPSKVDTTYVTSVLGDMTAKSANTNVIGPLKALGLLSDQGEPTELAHRWRFDDQYKEVCNEIRANLYPEALQDAFADTNADLERVQAWFARYTRTGADAARKMARFYLLLLDADPTKEVETPTKPRNTSASGSPKRATSKVKTATAAVGPTPAPPAEPAAATGTPSNTADNMRQTEQRSSESGMSLHIDLQIHISPEASAEQIDQIFASMAKHLPLKK